LKTTNKTSLAGVGYMDLIADLLPMGASLWVRMVEAKLPSHAG